MPTAAKPNVHLFTFITVPSILFFVFINYRSDGIGHRFVGALDYPLPKAFLHCSDRPPLSRQRA
jgi:hypothetical protein